MDAAAVALALQADREQAWPVEVSARVGAVFAAGLWCCATADQGSEAGLRRVWRSQDSDGPVVAWEADWDWAPVRAGELWQVCGAAEVPVVSVEALASKTGYETGAVRAALAWGAQNDAAGGGAP